MLIPIAQSAAPAVPEMSGMPMIVSLIFGVVGIVGLVCWILEIVAAFKKEQGPLMGILSIVLCSLGGFVIGWIHAKKWGIQKIMILWTVLVVVVVVIQIVYGASLFAGIKDSGLQAP